MPSRATAPSGSPNFVGFIAAVCGNTIKSDNVKNISVKTKLVFIAKYSFLARIVRFGNRTTYSARFQSTTLLSD